MNQPSLTRRIWGRITEFFSIVTDPIIASVRTHTRRWRSSFQTPTNDWGRADYAFWRRAYRGRAKGLELSGLLIKPLVNKLASWTLGRAPLWKVEGKTSQQALDDWWMDHHAEIVRAWRGALIEGDAFAVINSDLSITLVPPDCVDPIVADDDYGNVIGWRITLTLEHPQTTQRMTIVDEYYVERRVHRVEINGVTRQETIYPNLIGVLPIVHIANGPDNGETFGHPEAEGLLSNLHKYGEVIDAAIEGNVLQGRPTPVAKFENVPALDKFWELYGSEETQTLPDGVTKRVSVLNVDLSQILTLAGGDFEYKSPGNFTGDTAQLLELLYYLYLEHGEMPEFVMGSAISSSKASAEAQLPVFLEFIKARRGEMASWLTEIATIALAYLSLTITRVRAQVPTLQWEELDQGDGNLTLETLKWAYAEGLLTELTALTLMPVAVEDPEGELVKARVEREEREARAIEKMQAEAQIAAANAPPPAQEMIAYTNGHLERIAA